MIHLFINTYVDPDLARDAELRECLRRNHAFPLLIVHEIDGHPTIGQMLDTAQGVAPDDLCIVTNADICFDESLAMAEQLRPGECYALSRWEEAADGSLTLFERAAFGDSQDCWIFRGPPPKVDANFTMGTGGCDNKLAYLLHEASLTLSNPCHDIHAIHVHRSGVRRWRERPRLKPPFVLVRPCTLKETVAA